MVPPVSSLEDVIDDDCNINQDVFDRDWKKYSDLENTPITFEEYPLMSRSWETQQYYAAQSKIVDAEVQIFLLKRDMEIDRLIRLELKEYKKALVEGHRKNLLKSFCRLSFLTAHTIYEAYGAGKSIGESYVNLFTTPSSVSAVGSVLKIASGYSSMTPPESSALANNTQGITKVVDDVRQNVVLEALESFGDPKKVGTELVKQVIDAVPVPHKAKDWKLTDADFNILREEHLENKKIGESIAKSYKVNLERKDKVRELEAQIKELEKELAKWETKEKNRVKDSLVDSCKNEKARGESTLPSSAGAQGEAHKELQDCLCRCLEPPGGQFSCSYDTEDLGWSPSCRDLSNGPCICKAYGCFRGPLPTEGECYDNCYAKYAQEKP